MKINEIQSVDQTILNPIQKATYLFCLQKGHSRKDWLNLTKLVFEAIDQQENLKDEAVLMETRANQRLEAFARTIFGDDAFDKNPIHANNGN